MARDIENSKIRLPLMKPVQRIVIGAEIFRQTCSSDRLLEHPADCQAIDDSALDAESDHSTRVLVHNDQNPIRLQADRFTSEQVDAPQAVCHMTMNVSQDGPPSVDVGRKRIARMRRTRNIQKLDSTSQLRNGATC
jgi:hypothetical protein